MGEPRDTHGADLRPTGLAAHWAALCCVVTFALYAAFVPRIVLYSSPPTGDQAYYLMDTISLVQDHDLNVANNYAQHDEDTFYRLAPHPPGFVGISAPYPLPPQLARATARPPSEQYGYHLPGLAALLVPAWIVGSWFGLWWPATVMFMCAVGALVALNVVLLAHEVAGRWRITVPVWLGLAFSSPLITYAYLLFTELPTGLLVIYAFRRLELGWAANSRLRLVLVGACIALIPWLAWRCVVISASLGVLALVQWWRAVGSGAARRSLRSAAAFLVAPVLLSAILLVAYNEFLFGTPVPSLFVPELGDQSPFHFPWSGADAFGATVTTSLALLFDRQMGLVTYTPLVLLAMAGVLVMWRTGSPAERRLLGALGLVILPYFGLIASFIFWNGLWNPPARYQTTLVPLLAAPLAASLRAGTRAYRLVYALLGLAGAGLAIAMLVDARRLWPGTPVLTWLAEGSDLPAHVDLRGLLPAFSPLDELTLPATTAGVLLASFLLVLASSTVLQRGWTLRWPGQAALGWLTAAGLLGAAWYVTSAEYLKPRTLLVERQRWSLPGDLDETRGLAYLDGRLYVTAYRSGSLLSFEPDTGTPHYLLQAPPGSARERPSDVAIGPDGLVYVLDSGDAGRGLLALRPDGQLVHEIPLEGRTTITMGFGFDAGMRQLHVADMVGGRILTYAPTGGRPIASWGGLSGGFNNVSGIAIAADDSVYAAEASAHRIQHLAPDGHVLRTLALDCEPQYLALSGEWLDATCGPGLVSINTRGWSLQRTRIVGPNPRLDHPRGLAYGPDNTLFVVDEHLLYQFSVQH